MDNKFQHSSFVSTLCSMTPLHGYTIHDTSLERSQPKNLLGLKTVLRPFNSSSVSTSLHWVKEVPTVHPQTHI